MYFIEDSFPNYGSVYIALHYQYYTKYTIIYINIHIPNPARGYPSPCFEIPSLIYLQLIRDKTSFLLLLSHSRLCSHKQDPASYAAGSSRSRVTLSQSYHSLIRPFSMFPANVNLKYACYFSSYS